MLRLNSKLLSVQCCVISRARGLDGAHCAILALARAGFENRSTTVLSPYLKFGCLSARHFWVELRKVYAKGGKHTQPPTSLDGQLLWREFYYAISTYTPNYDKMEGNPICRQVEWGNDAKHDEYFEAWKEGRTGYPWIDACMIQLKQEGHMHHLGR